MYRVGLALRANLAGLSLIPMQLGQHAVLTLPEADGIPVHLYRGNVFLHRVSLACIEVGLALRANLAAFCFDAARSARSADPTSRMGLTLPETDGTDPAQDTLTPTTLHRANLQGVRPKAPAPDSAGCTSVSLKTGTAHGDGGQKHRPAIRSEMHTTPIA